MHADTLPENTLARHVSRTLVLAWPMILSRVGRVTMHSIDVIVLGRAGAGALADYVLGQAVLDSLTAMVVGLLIGVPVLVARETGAGHDAVAGAIWRRGLGFALAVGLVLALILQPAEAFYLAVGQEAEQAARAAAVTRVLALALPAVALFYVSAAFLEALHRPGIALIAIALANAANFLFNLVLVFGLGPIPALGAVGCAWATVLTFAATALGLGLYVRLVMRDRGRYGIGRQLGGPATPAVEQARMGLASGGSLLIEASAFAAMTLFIGWLGALALAAHGVVFQYLALAFMIAFGIAGATQVRVGNAWGRKDPRGVAMAGWTGLGVATVLTGLTSILVAMRPEAFVALFPTDPAITAAAVPVMTWVVLAPVFDGGQSVMNNACRGRGDTWIPTFLHFGSYWLVMVPAAWFLAFPLEQGIAGIYQAIVLASIVSISVLARRFHWLSRLRP